MKRSAAVLLGLMAAVAVCAQTPKMDTVLYGASYYHEYMPYERLDKDVEMMRKAGLNVMRLGESTWSSWEPRDGVFEFAWMEQILDRLHKAGIKAILGTPTYSIPPWLYRKHPEIAVNHLSERRPPLGGDRMDATYPESVPGGAYGLRQNVDITHPVYRRYAERVIRQMLSHFKDHPAVIGFQVDNETHPNPNPSPRMHADFLEYLKAKFGSTDKLNQLWGFVYWGQLVNGWDELPAREGILNPGYKLEWERYQRKTVTDFLGWQAAIVKEYKRADQFITHNWPGGLRTNADQFDVAQYLDIVGTNPYHKVQDALDGEELSLSGDLTRSLKQSNYLITETNAQSIGWDSRTQYPPYDGQLRLNVYSHLASGANMVAYWHWHSLHYGQETYWKGVLSHDLEPNRVYDEVSKIGQELKRTGPRLVNLKVKNDVAILYSIDSFQGIEFMPFADNVNYMTVLRQMYRALYRMNAGVDFVFPQTSDFSHYKVLVVPPLYVASDELLEKLAAFVRGGGHLVAALKTGFTNEYSTVRWSRMPGPLRQAAGFSYQEFSNLARPIGLRGDPFQAGEQNRVSTWAEMLVPETAEALAWYDHPFFGQYAAITRNRFGKGTLTYEGTVLSEELQQKVLAQVLETAGVALDRKLPAEVRVKHGTGNSGKRVHYYLNYSAKAQAVSYAYGAGTDVLTDRRVAAGAAINLPAWGVAAIEER